MTNVTRPRPLWRWRIIDSHNTLKNGSCDHDHAPFRDDSVIHGLELATNNLRTKDEVYISAHCTNIKKGYKCGKWGWFWVVRGHPRSRNECHSVDRIRVFISLPYVPILHRFWDIARYWSKIANWNLPFAPPPLGVTGLEFCRYFFHQSLGYSTASFA